MDKVCGLGEQVHNDRKWGAAAITTFASKKPAVRGSGNVGVVAFVQTLFRDGPLAIYEA